MPACQYGAHTKPELVGLRTWLNADSLDATVAVFLDVAFPSWRTAIAAQLYDFVDLCELNPDPPPPFDLDFLVSQTQQTQFGTQQPLPAVLDWVNRWIRYQAFLLNCVCNETPAQPGLDCIAPQANLVLAANGGTSPPVSVTISAASRGAFSQAANGHWVGYTRGTAAASGGASLLSVAVDVEITPNNWHEFQDVAELASFPDTCLPNESSTITAPPAADTFRLRLHNKNTSSITIASWTYCFCSPVQTPPPQPPFTPPTNVPPYPTGACDLNAVCQLVNELNRRLTVIAAQVSDIGAQLGGRDVLQVLSSTAITGEGELTLALGTRAVSVELTALVPEAFTSALGRPRGLMRVGSIRYWDGTGYSFRRFIDADRFDDPVPDSALAISWQLLPGTAGILKFLG